MYDPATAGAKVVIGACATLFCRQVATLQEREVRTTPVGNLLLYAGDSYQKTHGRSPADDGLAIQKLDLPGGVQVNGVKVGS